MEVLRQIEEKLPTRVLLPPVLQRVASFQEQHSTLSLDSILGFRLATSNFSDYFQTGAAPSEVQQKLIAFAQDATGSIYAFWFYQPMPLNWAPIVILGSEGELAIIANDIYDFLISFAEEPLEDLTESEITVFQEFRELVERSLAADIGIVPVGARVTEANASPPPDFERWCQQFKA